MSELKDHSLKEKIKKKKLEIVEMEYNSDYLSKTVTHFSTHTYGILYKLPTNVSCVS